MTRAVRDNADAPVDLHVRYVLPPFFHQIPLTGEPEKIGEELYATAQELMPDAGHDGWLEWVSLTASQVGELLQAQAVYAGFCLIDMDGRNSSASVVITHTEQDVTGAPEVTAARTASVLRQAHPHGEVHELTLPCGPAVAKFEGRTTPFPAPGTGTEAGGAGAEQQEIPLSSIQVFVPLPNERELLTLELTTPFTEDWDFYSRMFSDTVMSVQCWEEPAA